MTVIETSIVSDLDGSALLETLRLKIVVELIADAPTWTSATAESEETFNSQLAHEVHA